MTDISSRARIASMMLVFLLIISAIPFIAPTQGQPTGVQDIILRPDGDDLAGWPTVYPSAGDAYPWLGVDETTVGGDGDATYATVNTNIGTYWYAGFTAPAPSGTITSVDVWMWVRTTSANSFCSYLGRYPDGGYATWLSTTTLTTSYVNYSATNVAAPTGGWTWANLDAESLSIHPDAPYRDVRVTQIGMIVHTTTTDFIMRPDSTDFGGGWGFVAGALSHYTKVNEVTAGGDGDTTYVATATASVYDRFTLPDLPLGCSGAVKSITSVSLWVIAKNAGAGTTAFRAGFYIGTTNYDNIVIAAVPTTYTNYSSGALTLNPATSAAWTLSDVQALITEMYTTQTKEVRVTQVGVIVVVNYGWYSTFTSTPPTAPHSGYWWPLDAYTYTVTTNESATLTNLEKPAWTTWTSGNSTLWGRIPITEPSQTDYVKTRAESTAGLQYSWQNYTFNIKNAAPSFTSSPVLTVNAITDYYYDADATDETTITYSLNTNWTGSADALVINSTTGVVNATQPHTVGWYYVDVIADDGLYQTYQSFCVNVTYAVSFFTSTPVTTIHWSTNYHYDAEVTSSYSITFDMETNWTGATISSDTGEVNRTQPHTVGWYYVHVNVDDGYAIYWQNYSVNVTNTVPVFTSTPILSWVYIKNYTYDANAVQSPADGDTLVFDLATNFTGATIVGATGVVSKTQPHVIGSYYLNVSVTDGLVYVYQNFTLHVTPAWGPTFTSSPALTVYASSAYLYYVIWNESVTAITFDSNATWLAYTPSTRLVSGVSPDTDVTIQFYVNITATSVNGLNTTYQNYTLYVIVGAAGVTIGPLESTTLTLIFGFGLIFMAFCLRDKKAIFIFLAGLVWILAGVLVFPDYDAGWVILSIAFGICLLLDGGFQLIGGKEK